MPVDDSEAVRNHVRGWFEGPIATASVTFLGLEPIDILRSADGAEATYVTIGCSRHAMGDPTDLLVPADGPRAEVVLTMREPSGPPTGLARTIAVVAASPAVEGLILSPDALVDLSEPLWEGTAFTAMLLGTSAIPAVGGVDFLSLTPITATEAAWVRLKGAAALRDAWIEAGIDVTDPDRSAAQL